MLANAQPKPKPKLLDKRKAKAEQDRIDREQRAICQQRSGARCEVREVVGKGKTVRCGKFAPENHHLKFGIGIRNNGTSILARHRLQVCTTCHEFITHHVLVPIGTEAEREDAELVLFERRS